MASFFDGLLGPAITQAANGVASYDLGQRQAQERNIAQAVQAYALKRQLDNDALTRSMHAATIGHLNAETQALDNKSDFAGHIFDQDGNPYIVHKDGSLTPATVRGAGASVAGASSPAAPDPAGTLDASSPSPSTGAAPTQATPQVSPQVAAQPTPKFGPRTDQKTPRNFTLNGKSVSGFVDKAGKFYDAAGQPVPVGAKITPYVPPVVPNNVYVTGTDANGQPEIFAGSSKGNPALTPMGVGKPATGGGGSASLSPDDRARMMNQAKLDDATMTAYENKVLSNGGSVGIASGVAGALSGAHGSPAKDVLGILGNSATGAIDPDYQRYLTAQQSYGRVMGNLQSKRYTDHQADIEKSISGLRGSDLAETIRYKQNLRRESLADPGSASAWSAPPASQGKLPATPAVAPKKGGFDPDAFYQQYQKSRGGSGSSGDDE